MYINEKSFEDTIEDKYQIINRVEQFVELLYRLAKDYRLEDIYYCGSSIPRWNSVSYPLEKWLSDSSIDKDLQRQWMNLMNKVNLYEEDKSYSFIYQNMDIAAGAETVLNDSYMVSFVSDEKWLSDALVGNFVVLDEITGEVIESEECVCNLTQKEQIPYCEFVKNESVEEVDSYEQMWNKREKWFPNLEFCPSVERDLKSLEVGYIHQVWKRLKELDEYAKVYGNERFDKNKLKHVSPETENTLKMYQKEHTFCDTDGKSRIFSWHSRFTGVQGRIFFFPNYREDKILIGYIGKKLKNASYPT